MPVLAPIDCSQIPALKSTGKLLANENYRKSCQQLKITGTLTAIEN
jgi:hypothetical protein